MALKRFKSAKENNRTTLKQFENSWISDVRADRMYMNCKRKLDLGRYKSYSRMMHIIHKLISKFDVPLIQYLFDSW